MRLSEVVFAYPYLKPKRRRIDYVREYELVRQQVCETVRNPTVEEFRDGSQALRGLHRNLTMRLSDAGVRQRRTKLIYTNHRLPPWPTEDAFTRDRSSDC